MLNWKYKVDITEFITFGVSFQEAYEGINEKLAQVPIPLPDDWHRNIGFAIATGNDKTFDRALSSLYKWADENLIWLG